MCVRVLARAALQATVDLHSVFDHLGPLDKW